MVVRIYYLLKIKLLNEDISRFEFETMLQVKNFMKHIDYNLGPVYELDKVTVTWNMDSGAINKTSEKVVIE